jgi:hypothetical protein
MAQVDNGPASGNGVLTFNNQASVEVHVAIGSNPLPPSSAPFVDYSVGTSVAAAPVNKTLTIGGNTIVFAVPA